MNNTEDSLDGKKYYNSYGHKIDLDDSHIQEEMRSLVLFAQKGIKTAQDAILGIIQEGCDPSDDTGTTYAAESREQPLCGHSRSLCGTRSSGMQLPWKIWSPHSTIGIVLHTLDSEELLKHE